MSNPPEYDPHRTVSGALTEVRTVLNRARTALDNFEVDEKQHISNRSLRWTRTRGKWEKLENGDWVYVDGDHPRHPDAEEIIAALRQVVEILSTWERL